MRNLNKLFRRISIRTKLVVGFCFFGVIPLIVVGGYGALHSYHLLNEAVRERLRGGVVMKAEEIQRVLERARADVAFLAELPTLRHLIDLPPEARGQREDLTARLGEEFLSFSRTRPVYYQVRWIDERGWEALRADFDGRRHYLVPPDALQDKSDRYYFVEALATPPGAVYVSPMDLNVERGAVEVPYKPVVRFAVALSNRRGEPRGVVILNLYASRILGQVLALGKELGSAALATSAGDYLSRTEWVDGGSEPTFASRLASAAERSGGGGNRDSPPRGPRLAAEFGADAAAAILSGRAGTVVEPGLWGRIVAFAPIAAGPGESWVLLHTYAKTEVLAAIRSLQVLVLGLGGGVLVLALALGVVAARQFTRPIRELGRGVEAVARGDYECRVQVETNDELEDLAGHFATMARRLEQRERDLHTMRERAERRAQQAQALSRIGTQILALHSLPRILDLVVDRAREVLRSDVAVLCLGGRGEELRVGAVSGAGHVLRRRPGDAITLPSPEEVGCPGRRCPALDSAALPTHVSAPLRSGEREVGSLCAAFVDARVVDAEEREFLRGLANQATIAIETARLHDGARELTRLEERERIAADLHDGIIQSIYAAGLGLEECVRLADDAPDQIKPRLDALIDTLNLVIRDVRNYVVGLAPERLQGRDLGQALAELARGLSLNGLLDLDLALDPELRGSVVPEQATELFQICREALTNVVRHARASRVRLSVRRAGAEIVTVVEDDGVGFELPRRGDAGHGLRNMRDRARRMQGDLTVETAPGRGTRIVVTIPAGVPA